MSTVTRTTNPNGTYRYELDGKVIYKASKVLYTHATHYAVAGSTPVLFHKTEAAARKATGYAGWTKTSTDAIVDGDAGPVYEPQAPAQAPQAPARRRARVIDQWESYEGATYAYDIDGNRVIEISAKTRPNRWNGHTGSNVRSWAVLRDGVAASGTADGLRAAKAAALDALAQLDAAPQAPSCGHCAAHPGWAHGDTTRRVEPRDVCGVCLGSGTPVPPAKRRAPRNGTRVRVNTEYPGQAYKGMTGKVHSKTTGDDGVRYVMVDFRGVTWPFQIHELDVI